jgi:FMN phosphatase YigB (HAD superfamily)
VIKILTYTVMKEMLAKYPNFGGPDTRHNKMNYINWWGTVIANSYAPHDTPKSFVEDLIESFSSDEAYGAYSDVRDFLNKVQGRKDIHLIVSSNGDPRVPQILKSLGLLQFFQKTYLSYDLGVSKPDKAFFDAVIDDLKGPFTPRELMLQDAWHIGDEMNSDLQGAVNAGWNGVLVDRDGAFMDLAKEDEVEDGKIIRMEGKKTIVSGFDALEKVLGL